MSQEPVTIERSVIIEADPETVFSFLIDPKLMADWFGITHILEARPDGTFRVEVSGGNVATSIFTGVTPNRRVAFTWGWESADTALSALRPGSSNVQIELEPHPQGTLLRLVHQELPEDLAEIHDERWEFYLDRLAARTAHEESQT